MRRIAEFVATVGVLLIENDPFKPWREPVPPALADARGWYMPTGAGPMLLFVLPADGRDRDSLAQAVGQWHALLDALRASDSLLLVVQEQPCESGPPPALDDGAWQVWFVDLEHEKLERGGEPAAPLMQVVDSAIARFFKGERLQLSDLEEQEEARSAGRMPFGVFLDRQRTPATYVLLVLIGLLYATSEFLGGSTERSVSLRLGANYHYLVAQGEVWRLVTANFLHFGFTHLALNGYSLFAVGPTLEKLFGSWKFLAIYVFAGITGALASFSFNNPWVPSVGASGALFGLLGAMLILGLRHHDAIPAHHKKLMRNIALLTLAINLGFGFLVPSIDNFAHLGGLVGGSLMALVLGPHPLLLGRRPRIWPTRALGLFPLVAALGLAYGQWYTWSGQASYLWYRGPSDDYEIQLPVSLDLNPTDRLLYVSRDKYQHFVLIESAENSFNRAESGRVPLMEKTLEYYAQPLTARMVGADYRVIDPPRIVERGSHRFFEVPVADGKGAREVYYATATPDRLFIIKTKGLDQRPWLRPTLDQVLNTFDFVTP